MNRDFPSLVGIYLFVMWQEFLYWVQRNLGKIIKYTVTVVVLLIGTALCITDQTTAYAIGTVLVLGGLIALGILSLD